MKRWTIISMITVLALALMGFGFAKWSDNVTIIASASTGELSWGWVSGSFMQQDTGPDVTCDDGLDEVRPAPEGKNVGSTTGDFTDTNGDGVLDLLTVTVDNAYPCYYNEISAKVENSGTIPVIIGHAILKTWSGGSYILLDGYTYAMHKDGTVTQYDGSTPDTEVIEINWMNNYDVQQHPGTKLEESFEFHVLQPAEQNHTYTFSVSLEAVQWNEIR